MSTNFVIEIGNLTRDPETRYTQGTNPTTMCTFAIAVNEKYGGKEEVNFFDVVAFGKTAENCAQYLSKGKKVAVTGRLKTGEYTSQTTGQKVKTTSIVATNVEFLSPSGQQDQFAQQSGFAQQGGFGQPQTYVNPQAQQQFGTQAPAPQQGFGQPQGFAQPQQQQMSFGQPPAQQMPPQQAAPQPPQQSQAQQPQAAAPQQGFTALTDDDVPF